MRKPSPVGSAVAPPPPTAGRSSEVANADIEAGAKEWRGHASAEDAGDVGAGGPQAVLARERFRAGHCVVLRRDTARQLGTWLQQVHQLHIDSAARREKGAA